MSNESDDEFSNESEILINGFIKNLQIVKNAYSLSVVRQEINKKLKSKKVGKLFHLFIIEYYIPYTNMEN